MNLRIVKKCTDEKLNVQFVSERIESRYYFTQHDKIDYNYYTYRTNGA